MKKSKKLFNIALSAASAALLAASAQVFAAEDIRLFVDEKQVISDASPYAEGESVYLPFRGLAERLGLDVTYDEESDSVSAIKGGEWIYFEVSAGSISTAEGEFKLSSPIKLLNDRCFVPLDAIYQSFGYTAEWSKEKGTVKISTKIGENDITEEIISKEIKAEDGTVIMTLKAAHPVFSNQKDDENLKRINEALKAAAENAVEITDELTDIANDTYRAMKTEDREFSPCVIERNYKVTYDRFGIVSIKYTTFSDFKGAHPINAVSSETYDLSSGNRLEFGDIFSEDAPQIIKSAFSDKIKAAPEAYFEDAEKTVFETEFKNNFYLKDGGAVFYFNVYEIAPYAAGLKTAEVVLSSGAFCEDFLNTVK